MGTGYANHTNSERSKSQKFHTSLEMKRLPHHTAVPINISVSLQRRSGGWLRALCETATVPVGHHITVAKATKLIVTKPTKKSYDDTCCTTRALTYWASLGNESALSSQPRPDRP